MKLIGAVLAGGRSTRFGSDKAQAIYHDRSLLTHAVESLGPLVDEIILCGGAFENLRSISDAPVAGLGPLGGINAALGAASARHFDAVLTVPCDTPTLTSELLRSLLKQPFRARAFANLPVCGLWPVGLAARLDLRLRQKGAASMRSWIAECGAELIASREIANVNTQADLARLVATASDQPDSRWMPREDSNLN